MKKLLTYITTLAALFLVSCASTSSVRLNHRKDQPAVAVMPLKGSYGEQASDLISEQLALNGVSTVQRSQMNSILREHGYRGNLHFNQSSLVNYGKLLGVKKMLVGTISTLNGPLYSFDHANITLKVVDVETGKISWIGRYGNSMWTSAISTQGDIQRGAKKIVQEFVKVHGTQF